MENPWSRGFERVDYSGGGPRLRAEEQQVALTQSTDSPGASSQPAANSDSGGGGGGHWTQDLPAGVDAGWVRAIRSKLIKSGMVGESAISKENLADPEHRKWLNRKLRKWKAQQKQVKKEEEPPEEATSEEPEMATPEPAPTQPRQTVIPSGRVPRGRVVDRPEVVPAPGGWVPAGEGLWWPPYPTTGGPVARPEQVTGGSTGDLDYVLNAAGQTKALEGYQ